MKDIKVLRSRSRLKGNQFLELPQNRTAPKNCTYTTKLWGSSGSGRYRHKPIVQMQNEIYERGWNCWIKTHSVLERQLCFVSSSLVYKKIPDGEKKRMCIFSCAKTCWGCKNKKVPNHCPVCTCYAKLKFKPPPPRLLFHLKQDPMTF